MSNKINMKEEYVKASYELWETPARIRSHTSFSVVPLKKRSLLSVSKKTTSFEIHEESTGRIAFTE
jgi:hypothetical protein